MHMGCGGRWNIVLLCLWFICIVHNFFHGVLTLSHHALFLLVCFAFSYVSTMLLFIWIWGNGFTMCIPLDDNFVMLLYCHSIYFMLISIVYLHACSVYVSVCSYFGKRHCMVYCICDMLYLCDTANILLCLFFMLSKGEKHM